MLQRHPWVWIATAAAFIFVLSWAVRAKGEEGPGAYCPPGRQEDAFALARRALSDCGISVETTHLQVDGMLNCDGVAGHVTAVWKWLDLVGLPARDWRTQGLPAYVDWNSEQNGMGSKTQVCFRSQRMSWGSDGSGCATVQSGRDYTRFALSLEVNGFCPREAFQAACSAWQRTAGRTLPPEGLRIAVSGRIPSCDVSSPEELARRILRQIGAAAVEHSGGGSYYSVAGYRPGIWAPIEVPAGKVNVMAASSIDELHGCARVYVGFPLVNEAY